MPTHCLAVDGDGGMATMIAFQDQLLTALMPGAIVRLDVDAGSNPQLCVVQLILAARKHAEVINADFALAAPATPALTGVLERAGLTPETPQDIAFWLHGDIA